MPAFLHACNRWRLSLVNKGSVMCFHSRYCVILYGFGEWLHTTFGVGLTDCVALNLFQRSKTCVVYND